MAEYLQNEGPLNPKITKEILMKTKSQLILILTTFLSFSAFAQVERTTATATPETKPKAQTMKPSAEYTATLDEIKTNLGIVPTFLKMYPQEGLTAAWEEMKAVPMNPNTTINGKNKDLIGLAVASQIPCKYCVYFHRKFAALQGATEREMNEAVAIASSVRKWSTYAYGQNLNFETFKKDVDQLVANMKSTVQKNLPAPVAMAGANMTTADAALKDVQSLYGFTPNFLTEYHKPALPAAWKGLRDFHMSANTALPMKVKSFIGLAVGAQMPCNYCIYIDSEMAKLNGATAEELKEAVLMAADVRQWSTFLNGINMDEAKFRREVDQMAAIMKKKMGAVKTGGQASATH